MEGKGIYTFASGVKYDGELKNGMFHGQGTLHFPNGYIIIIHNICLILENLLFYFEILILALNMLPSGKMELLWKASINSRMDLTTKRRTGTFIIAFEF